jgi:transcriptional regulator with PAS, ATPase and Fis domain
MRTVHDLIGRVAPTDVTVLVWGESGVGKEMVSLRLHRLSHRRDRPFVKVNSAALPSELLESELFGYERGAFTGAHREKPGKFELANNGTIFLDEISELPLALQAKLLQVLQDGQFSRLGSRQDFSVDVRVIAATNRDLRALVEAGAFREDLYYRLNVISIHVPALRERREEILALVERFQTEYASRYVRPRVALSPTTLQCFMEYGWPGNIRELENTVKRIVVVGTDEWVPRELTSQLPRSNGALPAATAPPEKLTDVLLARSVDGGVGLKDLSRAAARATERAVLLQVLNETRWNRMATARRLKISYKGLLQKIKLHAL